MPDVLDVLDLSKFKSLSVAARFPSVTNLCPIMGFQGWVRGSWGVVRGPGVGWGWGLAEVGVHGAVWGTGVVGLCGLGCGF